MKKIGSVLTYCTFHKASFPVAIEHGGLGHGWMSTLDCGCFGTEAYFVEEGKRHLEEALSRPFAPFVYPNRA